jgi:hypothetical protein
MPVKIARSATRPSFGLPELLVAIHTSRQSCSKTGKSANICVSLGVIRGIPVDAMRVFLEIVWRREGKGHRIPPWWLHMGGWHAC